MKINQLISFCFAFLLFVQAHGQNANDKDANAIKSRVLLIALQPYPKKASDWQRQHIDAANQALEAAMAHWTFSNVGNAITLEEAAASTKVDKEGKGFIMFNEGDYTFKSKQTNQIVYDETLEIYAPKLTASFVVPRYEGDMTKGMATFAVLFAQKMLELILEDKVKSTYAAEKYQKKNGAGLANKTLLVPREYLETEITAENIAEDYTYPVEIKPMAEVYTALEMRDPKYAVPFWVPTRVEDKIVNRVYIGDAENGDIYGFVEGQGINMDKEVFAGGEKVKPLLKGGDLKRISKLID